MRRQILKLSNFLHDLTSVIQNFELDFDCFSKGQLESKEWLVQIIKDLKIDLGTVYILCGWYGLLSSMMFLNSLNLDKIRSFDIDDNCYKIADQINKTYLSDSWRFKAVTEDIFKIKFDSHTWQMWSNANNRMCYPITDVPDTIINTSCEHTGPDWFKNIPRNKLVILQSNNFWTGDGHVNCVTDIDEFKQMFPLKTTYYNGDLNFDKYSRFMLIGKT